MRLRLEKRKAEREGNFESAALVLGLAERNQASKEETYVTYTLLSHFWFQYTYFL